MRQKRRSVGTTQRSPGATRICCFGDRRFEDAAIQLKGNPLQTGEIVPVDSWTVLGGSTLNEGRQESGRRELADWILAEDNPLTTRVIVNRIWLHHFGQALVPTPNDFGHQGRPPSHPELLDFLAVRFRESGWSVKELIEPS